MTTSSWIVSFTPATILRASALPLSHILDEVIIPIMDLIKFNFATRIKQRNDTIRKTIFNGMFKDGSEIFLLLISNHYCCIVDQTMEEENNNEVKS